MSPTSYQAAPPRAIDTTRLATLLQPHSHQVPDKCPEFGRADAQTAPVFVRRHFASSWKLYGFPGIQFKSALARAMARLLTSREILRRCWSHRLEDDGVVRGALRKHGIVEGKFRGYLARARLRKNSRESWKSRSRLSGTLYTGMRSQLLSAARCLTLLQKSARSVRV